MRPLKGVKRDNIPRIDPAPSRAAYRIQRLWLTPAYRFCFRFGLPIICIVGATAAYFSDETRIDDIKIYLTEIRRSIEERPEFMVKLMAIDGASIDLANDIRDVLPVDLPRSSFDLDLEAIRQEIEKLDAVKQAALRIRAGGVLQIDVSERTPAVIWRGPDGLVLLDEAGHRVTTLAARSDRPDLPLVVGEGVQAVVPGMLKILAKAEPISDRVLGFVRMGERRWDVVLDRGVRILLPETGADTALDRVIALDDAQGLLDRDLTRVDMRNGHRPTLQLSPYAATEFRVARGIEVRKDTTE